MSNDIMKSHARQINEIGSRIDKNLKSAYFDAVTCGKLLSEVKESVEHGKLTEWINANLVISDRTARRYLDLYLYRDKTDSVADLQEAYKQIEFIKNNEKAEQQKHDDELIRQRIKTGEKPEGWNRSLDYQYKKRIDDEGFKQRLDDHTNQQRKAKEEKAKVSNEKSERAERVINQFIQDNGDKLAIKEKLKLNVRSDNLNQDAVFDIINEYLNSISDVSRKIETAQNIIKYMRSIVVKLQQRST